LAGDLKIIPFVDGHFIEDEIEYKIRRFREKGFQGLKLLYVPEEDLRIEWEGWNRLLVEHSNNPKPSHRG
jgi:hypothetical protein